MTELTNMKTFHIVGCYSFLELNEHRKATREVKAANIADAIVKFNTYNKKIYGADVSEVTQVFELVWSL